MLSSHRPSCPYGLCIDSNNFLYVAVTLKIVCVYNTSGQFLGYIGNSEKSCSSFDYPRFIVSDKKGRLYISDSNGVITYKCYQQ